MNLASHRHNCRGKRCVNSSIIRFVLIVFDCSTCLEIVIGVHLTIEVSIVDYAITNVIATDQHINSQAQHCPDIALLVACGHRCQHLVIDSHRVACVAGQLRQDIHDMIVASDGSRVLFSNIDVITLRIKRTDLARALCPSHSMRLKHQNRCALGSAKEPHPQVQTEASDMSLSRHVSHPRKRAPVKVPSLLLFSRRCSICWHLQHSSSAQV